MKTHIKKLKELHACREAVEWAGQFDTKQEAWDKCVRGDWMLWLLGKLSGDSDSDSRKELVTIACKCARLALKYVPEGEKRPLKAIQTAEKWTHGKATLQQVRDAAYDAAAAAAAYDAAAYAAAAAAYAAAAAAAAAAYAAYADAYAYAAAAAARKKILSQCADIVRECYPDVDSLFKKG